MYRYLLYFTGNATEVNKDVVESTTISPMNILGTFINLYWHNQILTCRKIITNEVHLSKIHVTITNLKKNAWILLASTQIAKIKCS